ncbi:MAG: CarD family transcriptional regulator [Candidatus Pelethousia sp.]|nr:CarD family transcriptional regulator [Candidatus Pelethousia sp.]
MYQAGDIVIYGMTGACKVQEVSSMALPGAGRSQLYYTLMPLYQRQCTIHTPVDNPKVAMRPAISKEEAERLIDQIPSIQVEPYHSWANNECTGHYNATLKSHNCTNLLELTMSIYAKKQALEGSKRKFGVVDERYLRQAEELLFGELAVALELHREEVPAYIAARLETSQKVEGAER